MFSFEEYNINEDAVEQGTWFTLPMGIECKLAHITNGKALQKTFENDQYHGMMDKYRALSKSGLSGEELAAQKEILDKQMREIVCKVWAGTVLLDWKADVEFSEEEATQNLIKYPRFFTEVSNLASDIKNFQSSRILDDIEEVKKN